MYDCVLRICVICTLHFDQCFSCCLPEEGPDRTEMLQEKFDQCNTEALLRDSQKRPFHDLLCIRRNTLYNGSMVTAIIPQVLTHQPTSVLHKWVSPVSESPGLHQS